MNVTKFLLTLSIMATVFGSNTVHASKIDENAFGNSIARKVVVESLEVPVFKDGRIEGIEKPENLSKIQKEKLLKVLNFSDAEILSFPDSFVNTLLKEGGVKVELTKKDVRRVYTDLKGVDHEYTPDTEEEIKLIKIQDQALIQQKLTDEGAGPVVTPYGYYLEGSFFGNGVLTKVGQDEHSFIYKYRTTFDWSSKPVNCYTDVIAQSWQSHTTSVRTDTDYRRQNGSELFSHAGNFSVDRSNIYGTKADVDIVNSPGHHWGYIEDTVSIPMNEIYQVGQFASGYGHSYAPKGIGGVSISIKIVGIDFGGLGSDKWSWKNTFKIGQTYLDS